jgi:hypothetical protein
MVNKIAKYEYKIVHLPKYLSGSQVVLAEMAEDTWELVNMFNSDPDFVDIEESDNRYAGSLKDSTLFATFKRLLN